MLFAKPHGCDRQWRQQWLKAILTRTEKKKNRPGLRVFGNGCVNYIRGSVPVILDGGHFGRPRAKTIVCRRQAGCM